MGRREGRVGRCLPTLPPGGVCVSLLFTSNDNKDGLLMWAWLVTVWSDAGEAERHWKEGKRGSVEQWSDGMGGGRKGREWAVYSVLSATWSSAVYEEWKGRVPFTVH